MSKKEKDHSGDRYSGDIMSGVYELYAPCFKLFKNTVKMHSKTTYYISVSAMAGLLMYDH